MSEGMWVVFEGADGTGKSTTAKAVTKLLRDILPDVEIIETRHPGSTQLGAHIRDMVKYPDKHGFEMDPLSSQMLMFVDHVNFKNVLLLPALGRGAIVIADRCDLVSGIAYGMASGLNPTQMSALMVLAASPRIDMMFIMRCPDDVQDARLKGRQATGMVVDRFEEVSLRARVNAVYDRLLTGGPAERTVMINKIVALENVSYIDSTGDQQKTAEKLANSIAKRYVFNS